MIQRHALASEACAPSARRGCPSGRPVCALLIDSPGRAPRELIDGRELGAYGAKPVGLAKWLANRWYWPGTPRASPVLCSYGGCSVAASPTAAAYKRHFLVGHPSAPPVWLSKRG